MTDLLLPTLDGRLEPYRLGSHPPVSPVPGPWSSRQVYAAAHVVADPLADPFGPDAVDWEATLAYRRYLWSLGFGVAEAMDTAQRGAGLHPGSVEPLIRRTATEATSADRTVYGVTTDSLEGPGHDLDEIVASYEAQMEVVEEVGGSAIIMPSRALTQAARSPDDYKALYERLITGSRTPVMLHWLGEMFDPTLTGYWGHRDPWKAAEVVLEIVAEAPDRVTGVKVSMLDEDLEIDFRRRLPEGVSCFTGDDYNFPQLIAGTDGDHSDALLGVFDAIAPVAASAMSRLEIGDRVGFFTLLDPTVNLARHLFGEPTQHYKAGVVFLAYLTGHQDHFRMVGGAEGARSITHLSELLRLADRCGLIPDPEVATTRMRPLLESAGLG